MSEPPAQRPDREKSLGALLAELADETGTLVRQEIALAKAEINERLDHAKRGAVALVVGALIAYAGLIVVLFAAVFSSIRCSSCGSRRSRSAAASCWWGW